MGNYFADSVISSGCLVRADAVLVVGYPRADFFMDFVDHEFNLRMRRHGYEIAVVRKSVMYHSIGRPERMKIGPFLWLRNRQPAWRIYYIMRNQTATIWNDLGGLRARLFLLFTLARSAVVILFCDPDKAARLRSLFAGFKDGIQNRLGKVGGRP
jgi:rhamnosyltransferase